MLPMLLFGHEKWEIPLDTYYHVAFITLMTHTEWQLSDWYNINYPFANCNTACMDKADERSGLNDYILAQSLYHF